MLAHSTLWCYLAVSGSRDFSVCSASKSQGLGGRGRTGGGGGGAGLVDEPGGAIHAVGREVVVVDAAVTRQVLQRLEVGAAHVDQHVMSHTPEQLLVKSHQPPPSPKKNKNNNCSKSSPLCSHNTRQHSPNQIWHSQAQSCHCETYHGNTERPLLVSDYVGAVNCDWWAVVGEGQSGMLHIWR